MVSQNKYKLILFQSNLHKFFSKRDEKHLQKIKIKINKNKNKKIFTLTKSFFILSENKKKKKKKKKEILLPWS